MAVSSIAWMLLGSTSSVGPSARFGATTLTDTNPASGAVAAATRSALFCRRGSTPITISRTPSVRLIKRPHPVFDSGMAGFLREEVLPWRPPAQEAVDDRDEEQRGERRHRESADHGAAQRRVLLAALAEPERHRQHADDHGQRGHQHGTQPR